MRAAAATACCAARAEELPRMDPRDQADRDDALAAFLQQMRGFTVNRNYRALEALMLPTFRVEFDFGKGPQAFHRKWSPESQSSPLWEILQRLLSMGGTFYSETLFALPYVYTRFPVDLDPLANVVALTDNVPLLDRPEAEAKQVGSLNFSIVPLAEPLLPPVFIPSSRFLAVKHPDAGQCFVASRDVYSPAAHRAFFERRGGKWRWISLACATLAEPPDLLRLKRKA
jgi:hypothetical protein